MGTIKRTLHTSIVNYWHANESKRVAKSNLTTCLFKYTLPGFGFKLHERSDIRLHPEDKELALAFTQKIKLTENLPQKLCDSLEKTLEKTDITKENKRHQKKILNEFIEFIGIYKNTTRRKNFLPEVEPQRINKKVASRKHIQDSKIPRTNQHKIRTRLSLEISDYEDDSKGTKKELERIKESLKKYEYFLLNELKIRKSTAQMYITTVLLLFGWLYKYKNTSLNDISFDSLVKVSNVNVDIHDFDNMNDYYIAQGKALAKAKSETKFTIKLLEDFFINFSPSRRSKELNATHLVGLSKYLYKDITDECWADNYSDIPIIQRLRRFNKNLPSQAKKIQSDLIKWETVIEVLEELRRRADTFHIENFDQGITKKILKRRPRNISTMAKELQRFIILGLLTLMPPSRARVIRELRLGKTFKHGLILDGAFIPKDKLENPKIARYYIHLQPEDYKTGDKYGEWLAEIPNSKFNDGKTFYNYLDRWLYEKNREILMTDYKKDNCHDYLLLGAINGKPLIKSNFNSKVASIFRELTGEIIYPHKLRTVFRTYLVNNGATEAELESAAFWMRHSQETAKESYTKQALDEKLAPGAAIANKLNSELLLTT